ncbi:MAG TPA: hypothetical protein VFK42_09155 [Acidimicrobiales bacterium]|jgi:hypothetical protein|nr:hypothetical protein [Acidimicrobiales bacterium]
MAKKRTTFGKLQRERDKQQKQMAKRDRRINRDDVPGEDETEEAPAVQYDEAQTLAALAALHEAYDDGRISLDDFEAQRDELRQRLVP